MIVDEQEVRDSVGSRASGPSQKSLTALGFDPDQLKIDAEGRSESEDFARLSAGSSQLDKIGRFEIPHGTDVTAFEADGDPVGDSEWSRQPARRDQWALRPT